MHLWYYISRKEPRSFLELSLPSHSTNNRTPLAQFVRPEDRGLISDWAIFLKRIFNILKFNKKIVD